MANGVVGIDLIGNTGIGREEATAYAGRQAGRFARVINDIEQCRLLLPFGITPLYRVKNQDWNDDDAHRHIPNAEQWVDKLHAEAPPGCDLYLINEPGDEDPEVLGKWLQRCTRRLRAINAGLPAHLKRHGVAPNWGYGRPTPQTWDALAPYLREYVADGHYLAAHEGYDVTFDTFAKAYPHVIGRMLKPKQTFGGTWIITEFASSFDAYHGWECWQTDVETADKWEEAFKWYAANGFYVIPFTYHKWQECFRYSHNDVIKNRLILINARYPVEESTVIYPDPVTLGEPVEQVVGSGSALVSNVRTKPDASAPDAGAVVGTVKIGDRVMARPIPFPNDGYQWRHITAKNGVPLVGWLSSVAKLVDPPVPPEPILKLISHPVHVSQLGAGADLRENDCSNAVGQASALRKLRLKGLDMRLLLDVDNLIAVSPLATADAPVGVTPFKNFAALLGVSLTHTLLDEALMLAEIDADHEVIVLGNYAHLKPGERKVGHWFTIVGYTENGWVINDSYHLGALARITKEAMRLAQTDLTTWNGGTFAGVAMQGFLVR